MTCIGSIAKDSTPLEFLVKRFDEPDDTKTFNNGKVEIVHLGEYTVKRATMEPGWRWTEDNAPQAGTETCQTPHLLYIVSGRNGVRMDDGTETVMEAGDVATIPPGHDGWNAGDDTLVFLDFKPT